MSKHGPVSQWWDIRAENGDLLARIKAITYEDALRYYLDGEAKRQRWPGTADEYGAGYNPLRLIAGTIH